MRRTETPKPIWTKFCTVEAIPDVVTYTNFGDHRLRGLWVAGVKFPPLPLTFIVVGVDACGILSRSVGQANRK